MLLNYPLLFILFLSYDKYSAENSLFREKGVTSERFKFCTPHFPWLCSHKGGRLKNSDTEEINTLSFLPHSRTSFEIIVWSWVKNSEPYSVDVSLFGNCYLFSVCFSVAAMDTQNRATMYINGIPRAKLHLLVVAEVVAGWSKGHL